MRAPPQSAPIRDAARGNDGNPDCVDDLRHERQRADLRGDVGRQEHAAMTAGLGALGDDRIHPMLLEPDRFPHRGRR